MAVVKQDQDEEQTAFLLEAREKGPFSEEDTQNRNLASRWHLRFVLEILMSLAIVVLLVRPFPDRKDSTLSPVPTFPKKTYTFVENPRYLHENMFTSELETLHTLHHWIELSADGRGYVGLDDADPLKQGEPYTLGQNSTNPQPAYMVSVFHQLHCLSYIVQHFQTGFGGVELTQEVAHHSAHCFDYLRQSIMCAADTSLEGKTEAGPGWGSKHQCTDYDALLAWANEHTVVKFRKLMPEEAVL